MPGSESRHSRPRRSIIQTVLNKTHKAIRVPLKGGKTLFLAPSGRGQVHDDAVERPSFKKLVEAGEIEVLGAGDQTLTGSDSMPRVQGSSQGHPPAKIVKPKGDR